MPHRVTNFLRTSSSSYHAQKKKTAPSPRSPTSSCNSSRAASPSYTSDSDDQHHAVAMPDHFTEALRKHHRLSLPFGRRDHRGHHGSSSTATSAVRLDWSIESPPIIFHGGPEESTGALVSGQMLMDVREDSVDVDSFVATLALQITQKRPFQGHCCDCQRQTTELKSWRLLTKKATLRRGRHLFPFSALLDGRLPACLDSSMLVIEYTFKAEAMVLRSNGSSRASVRFGRTLDIKRSLPEPLYPHHSVRVFPPTNIKASAHYSSVIHPTGSNQLTLKLDGLTSRNVKAGTVDIWRLKKVTWRLEETVKTYAPACRRHAPPSSTSSSSCSSSSSSSALTDDDDDDDDDDVNTGEDSGDGDGDGSHNTVAHPKRVFRVNTRTLGEKQLHDGWKSDFSGLDGTVDMEFNFGVPVAKAHSREPTYACDTKTRDGTEVSHSLLIELIVSKEFAPDGKPHLATQTGTGRILRMHFAVVMTEFPGLGVSWDNESPPVYQDVPPSPPGYPFAPPIDYEELEVLETRRPERRSLEPAP
ncbi:hypothetical protein CDD80_7349 [Ophiocordyceps camponoti-rufipedis]|uniref:LDB19 N-terminal domain-containing protein n=1 Tax=Ophiocordyceps camponoti-rufipedis TaxID=2004952 RepID=A0A2C5XDQ3_9HYPO|nr:hypothetical protein CDD80_7349 [Ophiocordyceps camponoti-rufipedis]